MQHGSGGRARRARRLIGVVVAASALLVATPTQAGADGELVNTVNPLPVPQAVLDEFAACPHSSAFPEDVMPFLCMKITASNGDIKLGKTVARVEDPIEITVGAGLGFNFEPVLIMAPGEGGPSTVKVPGGILGLPALDPLLEITGLDALVGLGATPEMGQAGADINFALWAGGSPFIDAALQMPLAIKLENVLLGTTCRIPEFTANLTNSTDHGDAEVAFYSPTESFEDAQGIAIFTRGARFEDSSFAVDGATGCNGPVAGLGPLLAPLLNKTVSKAAGLPSPAGNNHLGFDIDIALTFYSATDPMGLVS